MDTAAEKPEAAPPGRLLAEERERQGLTRAEVAQRLHLSPSQIEAIEAGDYGRLPPGTFLRGFVRNYAKLLALDPQPLLSRLAEAAPQAPAPGIVVPSQNIRFDPLGERLSSPYVKASVLAVVVVSFALAAMYWWIFIRPTPPATMGEMQAPAGPPQQIAAPPVSAPEPVAPTPAPTVAPNGTAGPPSGEAAPADPAGAPGAGASSATAAPSSADAASAPPARAAGERLIRFRFRGESWVEIRDASDRLVFSRLNPAGSEAEVSGRPPLHVVVGNAPQVEMTLDGRAFPLERHTRVAVARFTVE